MLEKFYEQNKAFLVFLFYSKLKTWHIPKLYMFHSQILKIIS